MIKRNIPYNCGINKLYIRDKEALKKMIDQMHEIFSNYLQFNFRLSLVQSAIITIRPWNMINTFTILDIAIWHLKT